VISTKQCFQTSNWCRHLVNSTNIHAVFDLGPIPSIVQKCVIHQTISTQGVTLTGRITTGPPCCRGAIIRLQATCCYRLAFAAEAACRSAVEHYRRRPTPATIPSLARLHCVGGPAIKSHCHQKLVSWNFNVPFQHKYGYIRDKKVRGGEPSLPSEGRPAIY